MLTVSKKRTSDGVRRPVILPAAVLRSIGSVLTTYECLVAVRTCKNNEGLKPLLTSIEEIKIRKGAVLPQFVSVIEPSLISSIGCSVKVLEIKFNSNSAGALVQMLPRLGSLQQLQINLDEKTREKETKLLKQVFPLIPRSVRCLTLAFADAEALRYLGEAAAAGCLPVLEELAFFTLEVFLVEDMRGLQTALMAPSLGKNLKKLCLDFRRYFLNPPERRAMSWSLLESILSVEDRTNGILSRLETLVLGSFGGWEMLAEYLLPGERLPGLKEVCSEDRIRKYNNYTLDLLGGHHRVAWYEITSQTCCRSWFKLLHHRPLLQIFNRRVSFDGYNPEVETIIQELFRCLSDRSLKPTCIRIIRKVDLILEKSLGSDTCEALAGAMRSGNLRSLQSFAFGASARYSPESLASLGKALDRAFLPCLTSFSFRMGDLGNLELEERILMVKSFFESIPAGGLDNLQKFEIKMCNVVEQDFLVGALAKFQPNCFHHLLEVCLSDVFPEHFDNLARLFKAGTFPRVECVKIITYPDHRGEYDVKTEFLMGALRFLHVLSHHQKIKELDIQEMRYDVTESRTAHVLLGCIVRFLSASTSLAFFSSLQILKVTMNDSSDPFERCSDSDYISNEIRPLLQRIKAVRPSNLKTIICGDKRI